MEKYFKTLLIILLAVLTLSLFAGDIFATRYTRSSSNIDTSLSDQTSRRYSRPSKIYVTQVTTSEPTFSSNPRSWYKALYYYSITRMGFVDIPFTYVIDRDGNIYEGRDGGPTVSPEYGGETGIVTIGYLSNSSDITPQASNALITIVSEVSYLYGVNRDGFDVVTMSYEQDSNGRAKSLFESTKTLFTQNVIESIRDLVFHDKEHLQYKAEIIDVKYPTQIKAGEKGEVEVTIKNLNEFPWFTDKQYIYISTKDGKNSRFAINGVWDSFSKPTGISNQTVLPNNTTTLKFEIQALLLPGKYKEEFNLVREPSTKFENTDVILEFEIVKGDFSLVQVVNTPGGVLNVRECPSGGCKAITQVEEGQVYVMIENNGFGWYRIRYEEGKEGWVYGPYIKVL